MGINHKLIETRIRNLCIKRGVSVNKMLKEAGLSKSVMDNIKRGRTPSSETILDIATYFDVTTDYLLAKSNIPNTEKALLEHETCSFEWFRQELVRRGSIKPDRDLSDEQLSTALNALDKLINAVAE